MGTLCISLMVPTVFHSDLFVDLFLVRVGFFSSVCSRLSQGEQLGGVRAEHVHHPWSFSFTLALKC